MINSRDINDLHPYVKHLAKKLIAEADKQGLKVLITSTLRDAEYQAYLYSQGRSRPGQVVTNVKLPSAHGFGLAFDVCQNIKGREWEDDFFKKVGKIGVSLGLEWGGNFKTFIDRPHFQYVGGLTNAELRSGMMPKFPEINDGYKKLDYKQILQMVTDTPDKWDKAINTIVQMAKDKGDLGDLEIFQYLPVLIEKIYDKGVGIK